MASIRPRSEPSANWRDSDLFDERSGPCSSTRRPRRARRRRSRTSWRPGSVRLFTNAEFVELAAWVALENLRSRFNAGLGLHAQGFSESWRSRLTVSRRGRGPADGRCVTPRPMRPRSRSGARCSSASRYRMLGSAADAEDMVQEASSAGCAGATSRSDRSAPISSPSSRDCASTSSSRPALAACHVLRAMAARAGGDGRDVGGRAGGLPLAGLPRSARGADAAGAGRLSPPRHLRLHLRGGRHARSGRTAPACRQLAARARAAHRGATATLRRRPATRTGADRSLPSGVCHG